MSLLYQHPLFKIEKKGVMEPAVPGYLFLWHCVVYSSAPPLPVLIVLRSIFSWVWRHEITCSHLGILVIRTLVRINDLNPPIGSVAGSPPRRINVFLYLHVVIVVHVVHLSGHVRLQNIIITICICSLFSSTYVASLPRIFPLGFLRRLVLRGSCRSLWFH